MYTNKRDIPLALSVWIVHDEYDYIDADNYISATSLMRPIRQIVLPPRIPRELRTVDLEDRISMAMGHAFHDSVEKAWIKGYRTNLRKLGHPEGMIDRVLINPTPEELQKVEKPIPIYIEQRAFKPITVNGKTLVLGGKFDMLAEGMLQDVKSTSSYSWVYGGRDEDFILQGSIYRWLNTGGFNDVELKEPIGIDRVEEDFLRINFIFTDWRKSDAQNNPKYPQSRILYKDYPLMSLEETEQWIKSKLAQVLKYRDAPEDLIPECTDEELWRDKPKFKYYSNPNNIQGRSTKNFESLSEANKHMADRGKGIVITEPGEVKRCKYCPAFLICSQKDRYFNE